jgi:Cyclic nucleotide-binding domain
VSLARLDAIEAALQKPGKEGLVALLGLKNERSERRSSLEPPGGLPALTDTAVAQQGVPMAARRERLQIGGWLRECELFRDLSVAEAAVLGTFFERCEYTQGETIIRRGDSGDELYLIEGGEARVQIPDWAGNTAILATLGPGNYFGEIALVTGQERTADVVGATPMTLLRLTRDAYARYLAHLIDVDSKLTRTALSRTHATLRHNRGG